MADSLITQSCTQGGMTAMCVREVSSTIAQKYRSQIKMASMRWRATQRAAKSSQIGQLPARKYSACRTFAGICSCHVACRHSKEPEATQSASLLLTASQPK